MHAAPERSLEQRRAALKKANKHRFERAEWKREVKYRGHDPLPVMIEPPAEFETMKVYDVLMALPKVGRVKANTMLRVAGVSPSKTLARLSARQRGELVALMPRTSGRPGN